MNSKKKLNPPEVMDKPLKLFVRSTGLFLVIATVIHGTWYCLREMFVPKEEQTYHPIISRLEAYFKQDEGKQLNNTKSH